MSASCYLRTKEWHTNCYYDNYSKSYLSYISVLLYWTSQTMANIRFAVQDNSAMYPGQHIVSILFNGNILYLNTINHYLCNSSEGLAPFITIHSISIYVWNHHITASFMCACFFMPFNLDNMLRSRFIDRVALNKQYKTIQKN